MHSRRGRLDVSRTATLLLAGTLFTLSILLTSVIHGVRTSDGSLDSLARVVPEPDLATAETPVTVSVLPRVHIGSQFVAKIAFYNNQTEPLSAYASLVDCGLTSGNSLTIDTKSIEELVAPGKPTTVLVLATVAPDASPGLRRCTALVETDTTEYRRPVFLQLDPASS